MDLKHLLCRFWYFVWFVALPLVAAWLIVDQLARRQVIEELEIWYILLVFAGLAFVVYGLRDKLPGWQDRRTDSPYLRRQRQHEARRMVREVRRLLARKGHKVPERGHAEVTEALTAVQAALDPGDHTRLEPALVKLEEKTNRWLSFARKSAGREYFESIGVAVLVALVLRLFVIEAFKIPSESMVPTLMVGDHIFVSKYRYGLSLPFTNQRLVRFAPPVRGDVVVFVKPSIEEQTGLPAPALPFADEYETVGKDFIKRVVGLPGDKVEMRADRLWINDRPVPRCAAGRQRYKTLDRVSGRWLDHEAERWIERLGETRYTIIEEALGPRNDFGPALVPPGQVFVLGDNRDNSNDSRYWGSVPYDNIKGRAMVIWWSNRRPHGFQWDRVGRFIMNDPPLDDQARSALARCPELR